MDPNETDTIPDDVLNPDAPTEPEQEPSLDEALAESLDRAIEESAPDDAADGKPELPEGTASETPAEEAQPEAKDPAKGEPDGKPGPDAEAEAEITALGLKKDSADRFREMAAKIKELAPVREQLEAAGIKDVGELPQLVKRAAEVESLRPEAERGKQWEETIRSTGADPQQMGNALNYLAAINSGDPAAMGQAYDFMQQEMAWLAKQLGRPAPGYDPLAEHAELAKQVADGDMTRAAAEELIRARRATALQHDSQQRQWQAREYSEAASHAQEQAMQEVQALGAQLRAADPQHFDVKFKTIQPMVAVIQGNLPPQQWASAIQEAYAAAPTPVAAAPAPAAPAQRPAPSAVRPGGPRGSMAPRNFDSVEDALNFAIDGPPSR